MSKSPAFPVVPIAIAVALVVAVWTAISLTNPGGGWTGPQGNGSAKLVRAHLKRDYQNGILTLKITYENTTAKPVRLEPPFVRLLSADSKPVFPYSIDAGSRPDPSVPAGERKTVTLHYWLEPGHFAESLDLSVGTQEIPIKSKNAFDIQSIENQKTIPLNSPDWTTDRKS